VERLVGHVLEDSSGSFAPAKEVEQDHYQGHHEQDMDDAAHGVAGDKTEQPEDDQNYRNRV